MVPPVTEARCCGLSHRAAGARCWRGPEQHPQVGSASSSHRTWGLQGSQPGTGCHQMVQGTSVLPGPQWLGESCIPWRTLLQGAGEPQPLAGRNNSCLHPAGRKASALATEQPLPGDVCEARTCWHCSGAELAAGWAAGLWQLGVPTVSPPWHSILQQTSMSSLWDCFCM